jgi:hypothetical protein
VIGRSAGRRHSMCKYALSALRTHVDARSLRVCGVSLRGCRLVALSANRVTVRLAERDAAIATQVDADASMRSAFVNTIGCLMGPLKSDL